MIKIKLIAPGRLKEKYLRDAVEEYVKRLSRYCDLEITEPEPQRLPERPSAGEIASALETEAVAMLKKIPDTAFVVALCVEGGQMSSERFAETVSALASRGTPLVLIVGSSYGLSESVKSRADLRLSLSHMTFPHQLFRVMLLEQLYRAFKINEGGEYHK